MVVGTVCSLQLLQMVVVVCKILVCFYPTGTICGTAASAAALVGGDDRPLTFCFGLRFGSASLSRRQVVSPSVSFFFVTRFWPIRNQVLSEGDNLGPWEEPHVEVMQMERKELSTVLFAFVSTVTLCNKMCKISTARLGSPHFPRLIELTSVRLKYLSSTWCNVWIDRKEESIEVHIPNSSTTQLL